MSTAEPLWYLIDRNERLCVLSPTWAVSALANGAPQLLPSAILGRSLWDFIVDDVTRQIYRALLSRVRQQEGVMRFRLRCDSPDERRLLQMQITAMGGGALMIVTHLIDAQPRTAVPLLDVTEARSAERIPACAWCMRVCVRQAWLVVEDAVNARWLFEAPPFPQLAYTICPECRMSARLLRTSPPSASAGQVVFGQLDPAVGEDDRTGS